MSQLAGDKVLIMAGGTGGHVFPALTIAEELLARGSVVEWLGTRQGLEARVIGETTIPLHFISVSGLRGKSLMRKLLAPVVVSLAVIQAMFKIYRIKPACVLGMGGFVTGPGGVAARLLRKPLLIHEQNAIAGLTNYLLHPIATVVMEGFAGAFARKREITASGFMKNWVSTGREQVVGNPVRAQLARGIATPREQSVRQRHVLVLGGSLGATTINAVVPQVLKLFSEDTRPAVLHQCGSRNTDTTLSAYREAGLNPDESLKVVPFIDDMAAAYQWADLVVCRSGASTVAELAVMGKPAIFIPYVHAVDDHQTENALAMVKAGGATLVPQSQLSPAMLYDIVHKQLHDPDSMNRMGQAAQSLATPLSAQKAADLCQEACRV